jgi:hypothetical protein
LRRRRVTNTAAAHTRRVCRSILAKTGQSTCPVGCLNFVAFNDASFYACHRISQQPAPRFGLSLSLVERLVREVFSPVSASPRKPAFTRENGARRRKRRYPKSGSNPCGQSRMQSRMIVRPFAVLAWVWIGLFAVNIRLKEASMSRYPEWEQYKRHTYGYCYPW